MAAPVYDDQRRDQEDRNPADFEREFAERANSPGFGQASKKLDDTDRKKSASPEDLGKAESAAGSGAGRASESSTTSNSGAGGNVTANFGGGFWKAESAASKVAGGGVTAFLWGSRRRKQATIGGSIAGLLVGGGFLGLSILSGPFEFIHIAQLMEQHHFSVLQDDSDDRVVKIARFIRYARQGKVENTRLGFLGNKMANAIESKLNASGIESVYSDKFGVWGGYSIDPEKLAGTDLDNLEGKSSEEITSYLQDTYNIPANNISIDDSTGNILISADGLGYYQSRGLISSMMQEAGYSKITSAIGARIMGQRASLSQLWHPFQNLDTKLKSAVENWWNNRNQQVEDGSEPPTVDASAEPNNNGEADPSATSAADTANATGAQAQQAGAEAAGGNTTAIPKLQDSLSSTLLKGAGGAAAVVGVACIARSIAENADSIKQAQVVLPLIRMGMTAITEGNQIMDGTDVNLDELSKASQQFYDSTNHTSWDSAQSIQAEEGEPQTGPSPDKTLTTISSGTPFDFLTQGAVGTSLGAVCSTPVQVGSTVISFLGGPVSAAASLVIGRVAQPLERGAIGDFAHWLAGKAIDVGSAQGATYGYDIDYGSRLAANDQAIAAGGRELSSQESTQLADAVNNQAQSTFQSQSLAYRLFDPYDDQSLVSKVMDQMSPSVSQNVASLASSFLDIGHTLATLPEKLFATVVHAQAANSSYNYGFPEYGFSEAEMNNPAVENPFQNASDVASMLSGPDGQSLISRAQACFGVTISQQPDPENQSQMEWGVSGGSSTIAAYGSAYSSVQSSDNCNDTSTSWLQVRMFIFDTENMESIACYQGDAESCSAVGF